jgi:hypothetical protein
MAVCSAIVGREVYEWCGMGTTADLALDDLETLLMGDSGAALKAKDKGRSLHGVYLAAFNALDSYRDR